MMQDLESRRDLLDQLFRYSQVGRCLNSVAHDVNNHLGAMLAYADLIQLAKDLSPESRRMAEQIGGAVQRCAELINALTIVARTEKPDASMVDLTEFVDRVLELRRYDFRVARIALEMDLAAGLPSLIIDMPRIEMAILYLLTNAFEAAQGTENPRVRLRGEYQDGVVRLSFWDSGPPVPADERQRIFEPLYTTKGEGHIGLGLTLARETAQYHDGDLHYDPEQGFVLCLPAKNKLTLSA